MVKFIAQAQEFMGLRDRDPLTAACNRVAWLLASNTPLYPFYLWYLWPSLAPSALALTGLSFPLFAAVPFLARKHPTTARGLLCVAGSFNTVWVGQLLSPEAGIALFYLPCIILAVLAFRTLAPRLGFALLPAALYYLHPWMPKALLACTTACASIERLNIWSVGLLCAVLPYILTPIKKEEAP